MKKKRVHRLYCLNGLKLVPRRRKCHVSLVHSKAIHKQRSMPNEAKAMDFVAD